MRVSNLRDVVDVHVAALLDSLLVAGRLFGLGWLRDE